MEIIWNQFTAGNRQWSHSDAHRPAAHVPRLEEATGPWMLSDVPDDALRDLEWKKLVGTYLLRGKYLLINWTQGKTTVTDRGEVIELQRELLDLARETNVRHIPTYAPVPPKQLVEGLQKVSEATAK